MNEVSNKLGIVFVMLLAFSTGPASALGSQQEGAAAGVVAVAKDVVAPDVVRIIRDPRGGALWLLLRDGAHPGGPGRMVRAGELSGGNVIPAVTDVASPLIRAGDRLLVEEHTPHADVDMDGVALEPARVGHLLRVRIEASSGIVNARVLAAGRATLINAFTDGSKEKP